MASDLRSAVAGLETAVEQRNKSNEIYALAKHRFETLVVEMENAPKPKVRKKAAQETQAP